MTGTHIFISRFPHSLLAWRREAATVHYWTVPNNPSNSTWIVPGTEQD